MGYFSQYAIRYHSGDNDHSYTPPEKVLLWRLEDLEARLLELTTQKTGKMDPCVCFPRESLRYALPAHFLSVSDVLYAIDLAVEELAERYGIYVRGKPVEEVPEMDEITGMQISFPDILSVHTLQVGSLAA